MYGLSREKLDHRGELHERIRRGLEARWAASRNKMHDLHAKWRKDEEQFLAYLPEREADAKRRVEREQGGKPQYTTLVLPYSYALLMSAHSYWTTVFLARSPVFQFNGRHGESQQQVQALEALIDYQLMVGKMLVPLHFWLLDVGKMGIGLVGMYWDEQRTYASQYVEEEELLLGVLPTGRKKRRLETQEILGYTGNKLYNIRPYDWFPDPRVPLWDIQQCEYHAIYREVGWNYLLRKGQSGEFTNLEELKRRRQRGEYGSTAREQGSSQVDLPSEEYYTVTDWDLRQTGPYGLVEFYVDLVPVEWGLGSLDRPEKWCFTATVHGNKQGAPGQGRGTIDLILGARPLGAWHNQFPIFAMQMEPEAYAFSSRSMLQVIKPLQDTMDWLLNAHMYNVRKVLNDKLIVDPSRVVMSDLLDPEAGMIVRAKAAGYGTDLRQAVHQLGVTDITRAHMQDMQTVHEFAQRAIGVTDQIMGMFDTSGRKSATEVRTSSTFGINRQKTNAEFFSAMGFSDLAQVMVQSTQQYYKLERQFRIAGDLMLDAGSGLINVTPDTVQGFYDFVPVDGTLPIDRYAQANLWKELLAGMGQMPQLMMQYDVGRIFAWVAQLAGLKNITRFRVQVMPDQMAVMQAQAGNVVPMPGRPGGGIQPESTIEPGQVPGMGQTG